MTKIMKRLLDFLKKNMGWPQIRKCRIIQAHKKTAGFCDRLIQRYYEEGITYNLVPKKKVKSSKIIWQYWGQGIDDPDMPLIVKRCFASVDKFCTGDEYEVIRLSDKNVSEYIELPQEVAATFKVSGKTFFSDLLRVCLLTVYGGCWLDATVLLTGKIPERYWSQDFFLFQRDESERNQKYWENAFAYYYGWGEDFKVKVLNSIFFCQKDNDFIVDLRNILLLFWSENDRLPDYFFFQILFNELLETKYKDCNCVLEGDCLPHYLQQMINDDNFHIASLEETLKLTTIHKLTYKSENGYERLVKLLDEGCKDK